MLMQADKKVCHTFRFSFKKLAKLTFIGERRRKQAENQLVEMSAKLAEVERSRTELQEKTTKLQQEIEIVAQQLEEAELK